MKAIAERRGGSLLYGTNFSIGVQKLFRLTAELAKLDGYKFSINETHHTTKLDAPSGTAITLKEIIEAAQPGIDVADHIASRRRRQGRACGQGDTAISTSLRFATTQFSRRGFALGAVRAAEWLARSTSGVWDFREISDQI